MCIASSKPIISNDIHVTAMNMLTKCSSVNVVQING